jgi:hypothetical protein
MAKGSTVRYHPTEENRLWLLEKQLKYVQTNPDVGLDRILDIEITRMRKELENEA